MGLKNFSLLFLFIAISGLYVHAQNTYYWVGGTGDFQDPANWSLTSGGAPAFLNPNNGDNVIFDQNSFDGPGQVVTTSNNIFCRDMDWSQVTNLPTFDITAFDINIFGSLILSPNMNHSVQTSYNFLANDAGHIINTADQTLQNVIFNGVGGGEWTLNSNLQVRNNIDILSGNLTASADLLIQANNLIVNTPDNITLDLGNSQIILQRTGAIEPSLIFDGDQINLIADQSQIFLIGLDSRVELSGSSSYSFGDITFSGTGMGTIQSDAGGGMIPSISNLEFQGNGLILGGHFISTLTLANSYTVQLENGVTQLIDDIQTADSFCSGEARLVSQLDIPQRAIVDIGFTVTINAPIFYRGIDFVTLSGTLQLFDGIDGGNNSGNYQMSPPDPRVLYWVGPGDDWNDQNNWSESSGGTGGACLPRANDNVVFDNNSFLSNSLPVTIINDLPIYLNSFEFTYSGNVPIIFLFPELHILAEQNNLKPKISGITITEDVIWNITDVFIEGTNQGGNSSNTDIQIIDVTVDVLRNVHISGSSDDMVNKPRVRLDAPLTIRGILQISGLVEFDTNNMDLEVPSILASGMGVTLDLANSTITITGNFNGVDLPAKIENIDAIFANGTHWVFDPDNMGSDTGIDVDNGFLGDISFVDETGNGRILSGGMIEINRLQIFSDGSFEGLAIQTDSLILSAGQGYLLNDGVQPTVLEYFEALGDLCNTITITTPGSLETLTMVPAAELRLSGLIVNNVAAAGGASDYFAGPFSEGTNAPVWRFPSTMDNEGARRFLGSNIEACNDETIVLDPGSNISIQTIEWFVNGSLDNTNPTYSPTENDIEVIASITTTSGCIIADTVLVDIDAAFSYDLGPPNAEVCQGSTLRLRDPSFVNLGSSFLWSTGQNTPDILADDSRIYSVTVTKGNCQVTDEVSVSVIDLEEFEFDQDSLRLCSNESRTLQAPNFVKPETMFVWNDNTSSPTLEISDTTLPSDGYYRITVSEGSCSDSDSLFVQFDQEILQVLPNSMDTILCEGESFIQSTVGGFDSVIWNSNTVDFSIDIDADNIADNITITAQAFNGVCTNSETRNVRVARVSKPQLGGDITLCETDEPELLIKPNEVNLPIQWFRNNDQAAGTNDTLPTQVIIGSRLYILEVQDGECSNRDSVTVTYEASPNVFLGNDTIICEGQSVELEIDANEVDDWTWSNTTQMLTENIIDATDTVSIEASRGRCTVNDTIIVTLLDLTSLDLGPSDTTLCDGEQLILNAEVPGAMSYLWNPVSTGSASLTVTTSNEYKVTVSASGCSVEDSINVMFDPQVPLFDLHQIPGRTDSILCEGDSAFYNFSIAGAAYSWQDFSNNVISQSGEFAITEAGNYQLLVEVGACQERDSLSVQIQELPNFTLPQDVFSCEGSTEVLDASTGNASYIWNNSATTSSIDVTTSGFYEVTVTENGCSATSGSQVTFQPTPNAELRPDTAICDISDVILEFSDMSNSYQWTLPGNGTSSAPNIVAQDSGFYFVVVTDQNNCISTDSFLLTVHPTPVFDWPDTIPFCDGVQFDLDIPTSVQPTRYRWFDGDQNPTITIFDEGEVSATTFIEISPGNECSWSDTTFVREKPFPIVSFADPNPTICSDSILVLDATVENASYSWNTGESTAMISVSEAQTYVVTVNLDGCETVDQVMVTTIQAPTVDLGIDPTVCTGGLVTIEVNDPSWNVQWSNGLTSSSIDVPPGNYSVVVEENGCRDSDDITVNEAPIPVFSLGEDFDICDEVSTLLSVEGLSNISVEWNTGDTGLDLPITEAGTYSAMVTSEFGCTFESSITVGVRECARFELFRPTIFSPNNPSLVNGNNTVFRVEPSPSAIIHDYQINIFNRWGNLMYSSNDISEGWDGRTNNAGTDFAKPDVYVYVIEISYSDDFDSNRTDVIHGDITIVN